MSWMPFNRGLARLAAGVLGAGVVGLGVRERFGNAQDLPPAIPDAEHREITGRAGRLIYYAAGSGAPILLVHSINAAASSYEMRPIFQHYRATNRVYAFDLPGYGLSERSQREYSPRLMTNAIFDLLDVMQEECGSQPVVAMALSLGGEFLARAVHEQPERFKQIVLISPTAFGQGQDFYGPPESRRGKAWIKQVLDVPITGDALFGLLNSRASQRYFMAKTFGDAETVDPELLAYGYKSAHQPGATHAPFTFLSGQLFSADIDWVYESLNVPVLMLHGDRGDFTDYRGTDNVAAKGNWQIMALPSGALPHYDRPDLFFPAVDSFLSASAMR